MIWLVVVLILFCFPLTRCIFNNLHLVGIYGFVDTFLYFKNKEFNKLHLYGIDMFVGQFGSGKTLAMTRVATSLYKKYGDQVLFLSNYHLEKIPYIPLVNFNQIVDLQYSREKKLCTVVLIDEIEFLLNNRNFSKFPLQLLSTLCQQRKMNLKIYCTAQKFQTVDKMWRILTTRIYKCSKTWRFLHLECFDAWDLENAQNFRDIKRLSNRYVFIKNQDFNAYDTLNMVTQASADDFISNDVSLANISPSMQNLGAVQHFAKPKKYIGKKKR